RLWTYLSPPEYAYPGERTGRFRLGGDQLLTDSNGQSRISYEDLAVAVIDEAELPTHTQRRFTVAY
ncbi:NADH-flavin reductase, partial [Kribbella sp. NPDC026611]